MSALLALHRRVWLDEVGEILVNPAAIAWVEPIAAESSLNVRESTGEPWSVKHRSQVHLRALDSDGDAECLYVTETLTEIQALVKYSAVTERVLT